MTTIKRMEESQILKFYKSKNVFITGGTGFMGKVLIEKLLRCTEVSTLYILIRDKKGKSGRSRLDQMFDDIFFDRLKNECPNFKQRTVAISGDFLLSGLGLNITDRQKLTSCIDIIFHVAATVKFDEKIKLAYTINVNGTKDILNFAKDIKRLKSLIYVSTAYSNCPHKLIEEKLYDCPVHYENVRGMIENISNEEAETLTPKIIGQWPNTYTFSKALAESLIKEVGSGLPIGIYRPAIVVSTYREPIEGWIDNMYGITGTCAGVFSGIIRVGQCKSSLTTDLVPVDTCIAGLISAAWDVADKESARTPDNIPVYNYVSSTENPISWKEFTALNTIYGHERPYIKSLWMPFVILTGNIYFYYILTIILHTIPGIILDIGLIITGCKPMLLSINTKVVKMRNTFLYFTTQEWTFTNDNVVNLWNKMGKVDQELFPFSMKTVHWLPYCKTYMIGLRRYLLKDPDSTIAAALKRNKRFMVATYVIAVASLYMVCNTVLLFISGVYNLVFS